MKLKPVLLFWVTHFISGFIFAQVFNPGTYPDIFYTIDMLGSDSLSEINYHPSVRPNGFEEGLSFTELLTHSNINTGYARSYNDGPTWRGRGFTQELYAGAMFRRGIFYAAVQPVLFYAQNAEYELAEVTQFKHELNYQFRQMSGSSANIDYVQRYGKSGYWKFHPGQSGIGINTKFVRIGVSTQNFTLGPSQFNHLIMSNSGAGFPHLHLGTSRKIRLKIKKADLGSLESKLFYGMLSESAYFDANNANDDRFLSGLALGYQVPYYSAITVGFSRVLYKDTQFFESQDILAPFVIKDDGLIIDNSGDTLINTSNDTFDQLASAFINWEILPGTIIFFEYGKNDFNGVTRRQLIEFEHSRLYTVGLHKVWQIKHGKLSVAYEHTHLPFPKAYIYQPINSAYTHTLSRQGYTHDGQLLGPGIGPGSVSDILRIILKRNTQIWSLSFQKIRFDEDYFITQLPNTPDKKFHHDVEYSLGLGYVKKGSQTWGIRSILSYRYNVYFIKQNDKVNAQIQFFWQLPLTKKGQPNGRP